MPTEAPMTGPRSAAKSTPPDAPDGAPSPGHDLRAFECKQYLPPPPLSSFLRHCAQTYPQPQIHPHVFPSHEQKLPAAITNKVFLHQGELGVTASPRPKNVSTPLTKKEKQTRENRKNNNTTNEIEPPDDTQHSHNFDTLTGSARNRRLNHRHGSGHRCLGNISVIRRLRRSLIPSSGGRGGRRAVPQRSSGRSLRHGDGGGGSGRNSTRRRRGFASRGRGGLWGRGHRGWGDGAPADEGVGGGRDVVDGKVRRGRASEVELKIVLVGVALFLYFGVMRGKGGGKGGRQTDRQRGGWGGVGGRRESTPQENGGLTLHRQNARKAGHYRTTPHQAYGQHDTNTTGIKGKPVLVGTKHSGSSRHKAQQKQQ